MICLSQSVNGTFLTVIGCWFIAIPASLFAALNAAFLDGNLALHAATHNGSIQVNS